MPAAESYFLRQIPYSMLRETVALWAYYLGLLPGPADKGKHVANGAVAGIFWIASLTGISTVESFKADPFNQTDNADEHH